MATVVERPQPPAEHTSKDPWPEGFDRPEVVEKLQRLAQAHGWSARVGYSRAWEKRGRGKVGGTGDARWVLRHYVAVQLQRHSTGRLMHRAIYGADVEVTPLEWTVFGVTVNGLKSNITSFRRLIKSA